MIHAAESKEETYRTYRLLPNHEIELTYHGGPDDRQVGKLKYRLSQDTLNLKLDGEWLEFNRAAQ